MKKKLIFGFIFVFLAFCLRVHAALTLPTDYDEPVYYTAARYYAKNIQQGYPERIPSVDFNYEHPVLAKLAYGSALSLLPTDGYITGEVWQLFTYQTPLLRTWKPINIFLLRLVSVAFGTMAVAALAIISPIAALALTIDSMCVKFTSVIYLEALPIFLSLLSVIFFSQAIPWLRSKEKLVGKKHLKEFLWLIFSAVFLGGATACKYQYGIVGLAIFLFYLIWVIPTQPRDWRKYALIAGFALISFASLIAADPYLYSDPINNLLHSMSFSMNYQNGETVNSAGYPFYQPFVWLTHSVNHFLNLDPQPIPARGNEFGFQLDTLVFILAVIGLLKLFKDHPLFFVWLIIGLTFLLIWNTKWPQYTMLVIVPLCLSCAEGVQTIWSGIKWGWKKIITRPKPAAN